LISGPTVSPREDNPHPLTGQHIPSILGHEFCGIISQTSPKSSFKVGQKVMVDPRLVCHSSPPHENCTPCLSSKDHFCPKLGFLGYSGCGGGFADYVAVEEEMLYPIPDNIPLNVAALAEPLTVAHHALKRTGFADYADKTALIVGGGPVGYAVILTLKAAGCEKIIVSEPTARRRKDVAQLVERVVDPRSENVGTACKDVTGGLGVDVAFDCAGIQSGLEGAVDALKLGGWWVDISVWPKFPVIPFWGFMARELNMTVSLAYNKQDFAEVMANLAQGQDILPEYFVEMCN
jgi:threonine dehydrogenase-like Zn-dependent dehydrogenase